MRPDSDLVHLREGLVVEAAALHCLWDLENRGLAVTVEAGRLFVRPSAELSPEDIAAIRHHREALIALVRYQPSDAHLFTDDLHTERTA